jgi:catechol 2,3-dioxygenase-like lactoylglutathione lyase family enzyme
MTLQSVTPVLRMFDEAKAKEFYVGFLGFTLDWEHRFEPDLPLYLQVSRDACKLHLTGHHGDCSPGAAIRIAMLDVDAYCAELNAKSYRFARPGVAIMPWGTRDMEVIDPFFNRLVFTSPV